MPAHSPNKNRKAVFVGAHYAVAKFPIPQKRQESQLHAEAELPVLFV